MAMVVKYPQVILISTTPEELRKLADKLEEKGKAAEWGKDCTVERWFDVKGEVEIHFAIDNEWVNKNSIHFKTEGK
jgi:hypothetical protein